MSPRQIGFYAILALSLVLAAYTQISKNKSNDIDYRVEHLLKKMTLAEKAGQMTQVGIPALCQQNGYWDAADTLRIDTAKLRVFLTKHHVGAFLGKGFYPPSKQEYYNLISQIQHFATTQTRLKIPIIYATDAVHGAHYTAGSTIFPHQIAMAATWNPALVKQQAQFTAYDLRASNTAWNFAPVLDINWQAQWGRVFETYGEDPYLTQQMGLAFVEGSQGTNLSDTTKTATCLKHLIGYGSPLYGKDRKNTIVPERYLRQYYLPPFQKAVASGAASVMVSSGMINGIACHTNKFLITDILKNELGFDGVVISDWGDMQFLTNFHQIAPSHKDAVELMVNAGIDMCMVPYDASFAQFVVELVNEKRIDPKRVDDAVRRILKMKMKLGLFEKPNTHYAGYTDFASKASKKAAYQAALEALTLLKNKNNLPFSGNEKILITGVAAHSLNYLNGPWSRSWSGQETQYNDSDKMTILQAFQHKIGKQNVLYFEGTSFDKDINTDIVVNAARKVDRIIVCLGEIPLAERPSDIKELYLPDAQRNLVKKLSACGKPITLILLQGRTRIINDIVDLADGIIMAYYPGQEAAQAIVDVVFGAENPSGKLPYSYQKHAAAPMPYLHSYTDRADNNGTFNDYDPQWPFGFGLSYATFRYDSLFLNKTTVNDNEKLMVSIQLTNTSQRAGKEVVQLYLRDDFASVESDFERLIRFKKVTLMPKESKTIEFELTSDDLMFVNQHNQWTFEPGSFTLITGDRNEQRLEKQFFITQKNN